MYLNTCRGTLVSSVHLRVLSSGRVDTLARALRKSDVYDVQLRAYSRRTAYGLHHSNEIPSECINASHEVDSGLCEAEL